MLYLAGIIEAVAREFFDSSVNMLIQEQTEKEERTGKKEHVVFLVQSNKTSSEQLELNSHEVSLMHLQTKYS